VALYGKSHRRWAMTERDKAALSRGADHLAIGPSAVRRVGDDLVFEIDEIGMPVPLPVRGTVRVRPKVPSGSIFTLDNAGAHRWLPFAPRAEIEVDLPQPGLRWRGEGYLDGNSGDAPLESAFARWQWARASAGDGAQVFYDVERRDGTRHSIAAAFGPDGTTAISTPPMTDLPRSWWGIDRATRTDAGTSARLAASLEDTPFYARSAVDAVWNGTQMRAMHESLSLDRFDTAWVRSLLPFRMPRLRG
jgi:carotenoid 1,2-hydratase